MARGPKKPRWAKKGRRRFPTKNQRKNRNQRTEKRKMLDMRRSRTFRLELDEIIEDTENQENMSVITANVRTKASQKSIPQAREYIEGLMGDTLEEKIGKRIIRLLEEYSTYR